MMLRLLPLCHLRSAPPGMRCGAVIEAPDCGSCRDADADPRLAMRSRAVHSATPVICPLRCAFADVERETGDFAFAGSHGGPMP